MATYSDVAGQIESDIRGWISEGQNWINDLLMAPVRFMTKGAERAQEVQAQIAEGNAPPFPFFPPLPGLPGSPFPLPPGFQPVTGNVAQSPFPGFPPLPQGLPPLPFFPPPTQGYVAKGRQVMRAPPRRKTRGRFAGEQVPGVVVNFRGTAKTGGN